MTTEERQAFWSAIETGDNPLLSVMSGLVEKWGLPAVILSLSDIGRVLSEDALDAKELTPNQRGLIISACAQICNLGDHMHQHLELGICIGLILNKVIMHGVLEWDLLHPLLILEKRKGF